MATALITNALLQPIITVPALISVLRWPDRINALIADILKTARPGTAQKLQKPLAYLAAIGAALHLNRWLSRQTANNWSNDDSYDWSKEIVLITGGSSGLGLAIVRNLSSKGIKVVSVDVNGPPPDFPSSASSYKADITSWETVSEVADVIKKEIGEPTVLINNAGYTAPPLLLPTNVQRSHETASKRLEKFEHLLSTNLASHYRLALHFVPSMAKQNHGHIVTISSGMAFLGTSPSNEYSVSKGGVANFHEALAMELKHAHKATKVRTTIYFPAWIRTPLAQSRIDAGLVSKGILMEADEVADIIVKQVLSGESGGQVVLPPHLSFISGIRGWPLWLQDLTKLAFFTKSIPRSPDPGDYVIQQ